MLFFKKKKKIMIFIFIYIYFISVLYFIIILNNNNNIIIFYCLFKFFIVCLNFLFFICIGQPLIKIFNAQSNLFPIKKKMINLILKKKEQKKNKNKGEFKI